MILNGISIQGYHGIRDMNIRLDSTTAIIGENGWGKSSLYNLLERVFGSSRIPCRFSPEDFRIDEQRPDFREIHICFEFRERKFGHVKRSRILQQFNRYWRKGQDDFFRLYYHIDSKMVGDQIGTSHYFADEFGNFISSNLRDLRSLIKLNPVLHLKDARMGNRNKGELSDSEKKYYRNAWEKKIAELAKYLMGEGDRSEGISEETISSGLDALNYIVASYMTEYKDAKLYKYRTARDIASRPISLESLGSLQSILEGRNNSNTRKFIMIVLQKALMDARGDRNLPKVCFPIFLLEDLESRLHPSYMMIFMSILEKLNAQKIIVTNSGDTLSCLPLSQIRRMVKMDDDRVIAYQLNENNFSADDLRRLTFHVRITRPMSIFARCWLLVEGETEIWLMLQLAAIMGINLQAEGIRIIEYAQCGASPLIKTAKQMGINWHLMADGDDAGQKYIKIARSHLEKNQSVKKHLTLLDDVDIEHFFYSNGFESVYRIESGYGFAQNVSKNKIIERAIHRRSKPGLAINIIEKADRLGPKGIPELIRRMFSSLIELAGGNESDPEDNGSDR